MCYTKNFCGERIYVFLSSIIYVVHVSTSSSSTPPSAPSPIPTPVPLANGIVEEGKGKAEIIELGGAWKNNSSATIIGEIVEIPLSNIEPVNGE